MWGITRCTPLVQKRYKKTVVFVRHKNMGYHSMHAVEKLSFWYGLNIWGIIRCTPLVQNSYSKTVVFVRHKNIGYHKLHAASPKHLLKNCRFSAA